MAEKSAISLQVAKGRSIYRSTGENQLKGKDGSVESSPKAIITYPSMVECSAKTAEFLLRTGHCFDPAAPAPEQKLVGGTSSTYTLN